MWKAIPKLRHFVYNSDQAVPPSMMAPGTKRWYNVVRDNVVAWNAEKQREREKERERERKSAIQTPSEGTLPVSMNCQRAALY